MADLAMVQQAAKGSREGEIKVLCEYIMDNKMIHGAYYGRKSFHEMRGHFVEAGREMPLFQCPAQLQDMGMLAVQFGDEDQIRLGW